MGVEKLPLTGCHVMPGPSHEYSSHSEKLTYFLEIPNGVNVSMDDCDLLEISRASLLSRGLEKWMDGLSIIPAAS